jgi:hypothetical protein
MDNFNINLLPRKLLTSINNHIIDINNIKKQNNVNYIHFYNDQQKNLFFNTHFLIFNETVYFADYFRNDNIKNIIMDLNSDDNKNFNDIIKNNLYNQINVDKALILYVITKSPGHELASLTYSIYLYHYYNLHDYKIVVSDKIFELGKMIIGILYLFFDKSKIVIVNNFTKVNINETYIFIPPSSKIIDSINFFLNKLNTVTIEKNLLKIYENICLIKIEGKSKIMHSSHRSFSNKYSLFFEKNSFNIFYVENLELIEIYYLIKNSKNIVLSWGANSWCNSVFVNKSHNLITLCHVGYKNEYNHLKNIQNIENHYTQWTPICNKNILIYDIDTEFTESTEQLLTNKLRELLE